MRCTSTYPMMRPLWRLASLVHPVPPAGALVAAVNAAGLDACLRRPQGRTLIGRGPRRIPPSSLHRHSNSNKIASAKTKAHDGESAS